MPSTSPTIADLYLAFRQAKSALFFERRGVGLIEIAEYEQNLPENLKALQGKLARGRWFDNLRIGEIWVVPKRFHARESGSENVILIGSTRQEPTPRPIDVQLRITPDPEFAITEVLYLWRFGGTLDSLLSNDVLGYRLDLRDRQVVPHRRWLFEYWPKRYQQFREAPLGAARINLASEIPTSIISGDLANFYDTIDPSFMLDETILSQLKDKGASQTFVDEYMAATASLLRAYTRYHQIASSRAAIPISIGVPIGALTSRVIANLSLAPLDRHIASRPEVICYRRYVDDLAIVARTDGEENLIETMGRFLPLLHDGGEVIRLDVAALNRAGSEFQLQTTKVRVHHLAGEPGSDFVDAVASDFAKVLSERRAFVDSSSLVGDGVSHLIRAGNAKGSPLRVLREADRARLERFSLATSLRSLERVSSLIDPKEARELVRGCVSRVGRVLDAEDNWVDDLEVSLRLLKLAICTGDWQSVRELRKRMDRVWGTIEALRSTTAKLYFRGREINPGKSSPWTWLRNYLHERRLEAISSCLPIGMDAKQIESKFPGGLRVRTREVKATMLRRRAEQLAASDLRARDREDDAPLEIHSADFERRWMRSVLGRDQELSLRLGMIDRFVKQCDALGDRSWAMPAARLFLCTRPPSYFDISRRWLYRVEENGFNPKVFDELIEIVNAIRGTKYNDPVGRVIDRSTISIGRASDKFSVSIDSESREPRIILGNLVVDDAAWRAAATRKPGSRFGAPLITKQRLQGLVSVLDKSERVSRGEGSEILVLPELALPRKWFRTVANHVVKSGRHALVTGLEYIHHESQPYVVNQVFAVLPGPFMSVAAWPWTKRQPAREEEKLLSNLRVPVRFRPPPKISTRRTVIRSPWGSFSVLICSELIEARRVADLLGRVEVVLCPAWNTDTASYDHLIQSVGFQLHAVIAIANNGRYSDCRAWAPRTERWERDLCRLIERDVNDIVHVDIPLASLTAFHDGEAEGVDKKYGRLQAALNRKDWRAVRTEVERLTSELPGEWRPLPPDWT